VDNTLALHYLVNNLPLHRDKGRLKDKENETGGVNLIAGYKTTRHFMERYKQRFYGESRKDLVGRVKKMRKPTNQQMNKIKRQQSNFIPGNIMVSDDAVFIVSNATLITCWRLRGGKGAKRKPNKRRQAVSVRGKKNIRAEIPECLANGCQRVQEVQSSINWQNESQPSNTEGNGEVRSN
jgi:hypothetical protein